MQRFLARALNFNARFGTSRCDSSSEEITTSTVEQHFSKINLLVSVGGAVGRFLPLVEVGKSVLFLKAMHSYKVSCRRVFDTGIANIAETLASQRSLQIKESA